MLVFLVTDWRNVDQGGLEMSRRKEYPPRIVAGMVLNGSTPFIRTSRWSAKVVLGAIGVVLLIFAAEVLLSILSGS